MVADSEKQNDNGNADHKAVEAMVSQKIAAIGQLQHDLHAILHASESFKAERKDVVMQVQPRIKSLGHSKPIAVPTGDFVYVIQVKMPPKVAT